MRYCVLISIDFLDSDRALGRRPNLLGNYDVLIETHTRAFNDPDQGIETAPDV